MLIDSSFLLQAAELAEQARIQLTVTATALHQDAHAFLAELHQAGEYVQATLSTSTVNGGCCEN
ncbi:hypothetical protein [Actinoplanes sp. N902-109]|uniref:hypothetical protein n=1 Tax=Actinoplanes sp. (strain N902-109) TaxID=649831 RepID=UPI0003294605|nr:hypothetical protein [Actinoplanes sp. N902-109]AGL17743.1 hypothetical protein L083_4233 [Actinoplanes sp. N902-109]